MAEWIKIKKIKKTVIADGQTLAVNESIPVGLGSIQLRNTKKAGLHMVRLSGSQRFKYSLPLHRDGDYRMGPNWGHRIKDPTEEKNGFLRVCRELEVPISRVVMVESPTLDGLEVEVGGILCSHSTSDNNSKIILWTDGETACVTEPERVKSHMNQYHVGCPCSTWTKKIKGGSWAITTLKKTRYYAGVSKVWIAKTCDPETLRLALLGHGDIEAGCARFEHEAAEKG